MLVQGLSCRTVCSSWQTTQHNKSWLWGNSIHKSVYTLRSREITGTDESPKGLWGMSCRTESRLTSVKAFELVSNVCLHVSKRRNRWKGSRGGSSYLLPLLLYCRGCPLLLICLFVSVPFITNLAFSLISSTLCPVIFYILSFALFSFFSLLPSYLFFDQNWGSPACLCAPAGFLSVLLFCSTQSSDSWFILSKTRELYYQTTSRCCQGNAEPLMLWRCFQRWCLANSIRLIVMMQREGFIWSRWSLLNSSSIQRQLHNSGLYWPTSCFFTKFFSSYRCTAKNGTVLCFMQNLWPCICVINGLTKRILSILT